MLRWFSMTLVVLFVVSATLFASANQQRVRVTIPGDGQLLDVPLFGIVFVSLLLGALLGALLAWSGVGKYRRRLERLSRQNRDLEVELSNLRNLPLENDY